MNPPKIFNRLKQQADGSFSHLGGQQLFARTADSETNRAETFTFRARGAVHGVNSEDDEAMMKPAMTSSKSEVCTTPTGLRLRVHRTGPFQMLPPPPPPPQYTWFSIRTIRLGELRIEQPYSQLVDNPVSSEQPSSADTKVLSQHCRQGHQLGNPPLTSFCHITAAIICYELKGSCRRNLPVEIQGLEVAHFLSPRRLGAKGTVRAKESICKMRGRSIGVYCTGQQLLMACVDPDASVRHATHTHTQNQQIADWESQSRCRCSVVASCGPFLRFVSRAVVSAFCMKGQRRGRVLLKGLFPA
ncbi:hypothetical protein Q8A73_023210 [Channa argus]|nr:hypothetical protein Q8A73_023210 [Channa argus]